MPWGLPGAVLSRVPVAGVQVGGWVDGSLLNYSLLSGQLWVRDPGSEERRPQVSGSEGTCKDAASQNPCIMSAKRPLGL